MNARAGVGEADPPQSLAHRLARVAAWLGGTALLVFVLDLLGIPVSDWISELFDRVAEVPLWAVLAGIALESAQTSFAALAWFGILRAALIMFTTLITGATFALVFSGLVVEKIFFSLLNVALYLYLFLTSSSAPTGSRSASTASPPPPRRTRSPTASRRRRAGSASPRR